MIYFLFTLSLIFNALFSYILFRVWQEKKIKYNLDRIAYETQLNESWNDLLNELKEGKEIKIDGYLFSINSKGEVVNGNCASSLALLKERFLKENKKKVYNYSLKKELDR